MKVHGCSSEKVIRCALICAACDLPAGSGFFIYNACFGCTRCWKEFPGSGLVIRTFLGLTGKLGQLEQQRNIVTLLKSKDSVILRMSC